MRAQMENIQFSKLLVKPLVHPFLFNYVHQESLSLKARNYLSQWLLQLDYLMSWMDHRALWSHSLPKMPCTAQGQRLMFCSGISPSQGTR